MANEMQRGNLTGTAIMRMPISGTVSIGGKQMKELRFMPYSEFPEIGREETLYIDTDGNTLYYYDGAYIALSGGGGSGTGDYNELSNKPQINGNTLTGNKTAANLGLQETISDLAAIRSGAASGSTAVQPATLATALETKQDVISDLASIRTGASKGDTAVQPSDMEAALSGKQDTISDLQTIRSGAALGATAVQPADMETALANKQDVINDLDAIRSGATAGNTALQPGDVDTLPTDGSSNPVSSGGTYNFVNSSIATNTAYFIGTFASVAELEAYTGTVTNNDYAFVTSTDSAGNTLYNRYKYNAATQIWSFEYAVNNTAFTAAQWAAIQSGMTSADKTKLDGIEQGANKTVIDTTPTSGSSNAVSSGGVHTALSGKQDTIADLSDIRSGAAAGATAVQPAEMNTALAAKQDTLTFDTVPTQSSTNPVTSGGIWTDQQRQQSEIDYAVNTGVKNLFPYGDLIEITTNFNDKPFSLQSGDYKLSFQISATTGSYAIRVKDASNNSIFYENGSNSATTKTYDMTLSVNAATITFYSSVSNNFTNIMIRPDSITDSTFQPYALPNPTLTPAAIKSVDEGAKNLLKNELGSGTKSGLTYTTGTDGSIVITGGTPNANADFVIPFTPKESGQYVLQGCPAGGSGTTYKGQIALYPSMENVVEIYGNTSATATLTGGTQYAYRFMVYSGKAIGNVTIYPMVCSEAAWKISQAFQPYRPSWQEMWEMIQALQNNS